MPRIFESKRTVPVCFFKSSNRNKFLDWLKPEVQFDLIDGKKTMHTPVSLRHARLVNFLNTLLTLFAAAN